MFSSTLLHSPHSFTGIQSGSFTGPDRLASEAALNQRLGGRIHTVSQVHGAAISWVGDGKLEADALVTTEPGVIVAVRVADCVPILLEGPGVVAAVHAGWRGTAADIVRLTVAEIGEKCGLKAQELRAAIGPAIGRECYQVGEEVVEKLSAVAPDGADWRADRQVDLVVLNLSILRSLGVTAEAVGTCTFCSSALWSHRRDGALAGRQVGAILR